MSVVVGGGVDVLVALVDAVGVASASEDASVYAVDVAVAGAAVSQSTQPYWMFTALSFRANAETHTYKYHVI